MRALESSKRVMASSTDTEISNPIIVVTEVEDTVNNNPVFNEENLPQIEKDSEAPMDESKEDTVVLMAASVVGDILEKP